MKKVYTVTNHLLFKQEQLTLDDDQLITKDNVKHIGEMLALSAIKSLMAKGINLSCLYRGLLKNIHCNASYNTTVPEGYDIAQNSIAFLCEFVGKYLGDTVTAARGEQITIRTACIRQTGVYINHTYCKPRDRYVCYDELENRLFCEIEEETSYEEYDSIIEQLGLTKKERDTIECYTAGMGFVEVARYFGLSLAAIAKRKMKVRQKYIRIFGDIR